MQCPQRLRPVTGYIISPLSPANWLNELLGGAAEVTSRECNVHRDYGLQPAISSLLVTSELATSRWAEVIESALLRSDCTKYLADHHDYVSSRTRSKARLGTDKVIMQKAHEEWGDLVSSECLASAWNCRVIRRRSRNRTNRRITAK